MKDTSRMQGNFSLNSDCAALLDVICRPETTETFFLLLQQGVTLEAELPANIRSLLCDQFDVTPYYVTERINTIFLDGKSVDDVDTALVKPGSILALSASMPGFVGAAFRKSGRYAAMREGISYSAENTSEPCRKGYFVIKLFNLTSPELGPSFLASGVRIETREFGRFLNHRSAPFWAGCTSVTLDERRLNPLELQSIKWSERSGYVLLRVTSA